MIIRILRSVVLLSGFLLCCILVTSAQTSNIFWLKIHDDAGGGDSLTFGNHILATYGIDAALGENETLPPPPGFGAWFYNIPGRTNVWGAGLLKKDLRDSLNVSKTDTFQIYFQNLDSNALNANVALSWPDSNYLRARCDSMILLFQGTAFPYGIRINMSAQNSFQLSGPFNPTGINPSAPLVKLFIYKYAYGHQGPIDHIEPENRSTPVSYNLNQNFPNPSNPSTVIQYSLPHAEQVSLKVFNLLGQEVRTLVDEVESPGYKTVSFNASSLPSGVYFYRLNAGSFVQTKKMVVMR